jgi:hypothetical protein
MIPRNVRSGLASSANTAIPRLRSANGTRVRIVAMAEIGIIRSFGAGPSIRRMLETTTMIRSWRLMASHNASLAIPRIGTRTEPSTTFRARHASKTNPGIYGSVMELSMVPSLLPNAISKLTQRLAWKSQPTSTLTNSHAQESHTTFENGIAGYATKPVMPSSSPG